MCVCVRLELDLNCEFEFRAVRVSQFLLVGQQETKSEYMYVTGDEAHYQGEKPWFFCFSVSKFYTKPS